MNNQRAQEVLYESEAALRLVDQELHDRHEVRQDENQAPQSMGLEDLPQVLERANAQIHGVLTRLRESRAALQNSKFERLQLSHEKLRQVTSATEDAAINIIDHASALLVDLEHRLVEVSRLFDTSAPLDTTACRFETRAEGMTFDAQATTRDAEGRQALADEIFTAIKAPAA